jgi:hypothetical protein
MVPSGSKILKLGKEISFFAQCLLNHLCSDARIYQSGWPMALPSPPGYDARRNRYPTRSRSHRGGGARGDGRGAPDCTVPSMSINAERLVHCLHSVLQYGEL